MGLRCDVVITWEYCHCARFSRTRRGLFVGPREGLLYGSGSVGSDCRWFGQQGLGEKRIALADSAMEVGDGMGARMDSRTSELGGDNGISRVGLSTSEPFLLAPNSRVRTFHPVHPANLTHYFPSSSRPLTITRAGCGRGPVPGLPGTRVPYIRRDHRSRLQSRRLRIPVPGY